MHAEFWVFRHGSVPPAVFGRARAAEIDGEAIFGPRANIVVPAAISKHVCLMPERVCDSMIVVGLRDEFGTAVLPALAEQTEDRATRVEIRYRIGRTAHPVERHRVRRVLAEAAGVAAVWRPT